MPIEREPINPGQEIGMLGEVIPQAAIAFDENCPGSEPLGIDRLITRLNGLLERAGETLTPVAVNLRQLPQQLLDSAHRIRTAVNSLNYLLATGDAIPALQLVVPQDQIPKVLEKLDALSLSSVLPYIMYRFVHPWGVSLQCENQGIRADCSMLTFFAFLGEFNKAQNSGSGFISTIRQTAEEVIPEGCPRKGQIFARVDTLEKITRLPVVRVIWKNLPAAPLAGGAMLSLAAQGQSCGETWKQMQPTRPWTGPKPDAVPSGGGSDVVLAVGLGLAVIMSGTCLGYLAAIGKKR